jgi:hypothetical protein
MSNAGQAALIVVGTVVGAYFGYPQLGFVLGSLAGSALFPTQLPAGPRISDGRTTTASIGGPVPIVFGTADVAGTVIWLAPYQETSKHTSAKGGPQQTTYQYNQSIAIGLCEGPIGTILRVWENGAIVYDIRPQQPANVDLNLLAETDLEYANRLTVSAAYAETFVLYTGTEDQLADPTIESIQGYGNVPAWRGLCYIVYPNRLLQTSQAWRHPNFRFEVSERGTGDCIDSSEYSNYVLYPWNALGIDPRNFRNYHSYQFQPLSGGSPGAIRDTLAEAIDDGGLQGEVFGWSTGASTGGRVAPWFPPSFSDTAQTLYMYFNGQMVSSRTFAALASSSAICDWLDAHQGGYWVGAYSTESGTNFLVHGVFEFTAPGSGNVGACPAYGVDATCHYDDAIEVTRYPGPPQDPCFGLPVAPISGYCIREDGKYVRGGPWTLDSIGSYKVLASYSIAGADGSARNGVVEQYPLNPCLLPGSADDNSTFWTAAYDAAVLAGTIPSGWTYGAQYPLLQTGAYTIDMQICSGDGGGVTIASIIDRVCARAGLTQVDTTDMAAVSVWGYSITTIASASAILAPLRSVGFFDAVETQGVMRFSGRGKAIVATLTTDDIGAYEETGNAVPPPSVSVVRAQDEDLPRSIRFKYKAIARDYQDGEQDSPFRLATKAVNDVDVSVPLCLDDTQAAQCAEVIWADAWAARTTYSIAVDQSWLALDTGDAIAVPVDGVLERVRIVSDTNSSGVLRKLSCVKDDSGAYISHAVPSIPLVQPQRLSFTGPSSFELLDLPALSDADNDPGFYVAAQRFGAGGRWNGALFYQSLDGGVTFTEQFAVTTEATMGAIAAPVPPSQAYTWDTTTVITVNVPNGSVTFESRTDDAILAGANTAAMGADGRWEIVQFGTATQVSPTQWNLSRLLRGRRGTEHVMGSSVAADKFVVVSTGDLVRMVLELSQLGAPLKYKAVSLGLAYSTGIDQTFTGHGQALVPFSPVSVAAAIVDSPGDIHITWFRRGRLGRTLMSGVDIPLSEATEAYQVDIYGGSPPAVVRTLSVSAQVAIYTAAEQMTDFGGPATELKVAVYQISATVGRGTPANAVLRISGGDLFVTFLGVPPVLEHSGEAQIYVTHWPDGGGAGTTVLLQIFSSDHPSLIAALAAASSDLITKLNASALSGIVRGEISPFDAQQVVLSCDSGTITAQFETATPVAGASYPFFAEYSYTTIFVSTVSS